MKARTRLNKARKLDIVHAYVLATKGCLPTNLNKLLGDMREIVGDVSESDVRQAIAWATRGAPTGTKWISHCPIAGDGKTRPEPPRSQPRRPPFRHQRLGSGSGGEPDWPLPSFGCRWVNRMIASRIRSWRDGCCATSTCNGSVRMLTGEKPLIAQIRSFNRATKWALSWFLSRFAMAKNSPDKSSKRRNSLL
jgi:hypothetical protein